MRLPPIQQKSTQDKVLSSLSSMEWSYKETCGNSPSVVACEQRIAGSFGYCEVRLQMPQHSPLLWGMHKHWHPWFTPMWSCVLCDQTPWALQPSRQQSCKERDDRLSLLGLSGGQDHLPCMTAIEAQRHPPSLN